MSRSLLIIINADDVGINEKVNDETLALVSSGLVTSVSLLANAPAVESAWTKLSSYPDCSTGVHLNISEFRPLSSPNGLSRLLDCEGNLLSSKIREVRIDSSLASAIYNEFAAQIEKILSLGISISHLDSHFHVHLIPRLFPILKRIQRRYSIRKVRIAKNIWTDQEYRSPIAQLKTSTYNFFLRSFYRTYTTAGFTGFSTFQLKEHGTEYASVELMVHPGSEHYPNDTDLLKTWGRNIPAGVKLINFNEL